jgi:hypothetical protein
MLDLKSHPPLLIYVIGVSQLPDYPNSLPTPGTFRIILQLWIYPKPPAGHTRATRFSPFKILQRLANRDGQYPGCPEEMEFLTTRFTLASPYPAITRSTRVLAPLLNYPSRSSERTRVPPPAHSATNPEYFLQPVPENPAFKHS